jgi:uncharacterized protein YqgC (DUF456 family)
LAALSITVTLPAVLIVPRIRHSSTFDRILWIATFILAFLGAQIAPNYLGKLWAANTWRVAELAILPALVGAVAGAFSINVLLWLIDRFDKSSEAEDTGEVDDPGE